MIHHKVNAMNWIKIPNFFYMFHMRHWIGPGTFWAFLNIWKTLEVALKTNRNIPDVITWDGASFDPRGKFMYNLNRAHTPFWFASFWNSEFINVCFHGAALTVCFLCCRDFLPRGSGIVTRRPLVLQLINCPTGNNAPQHQPSLRDKPVSSFTPRGESFLFTSHQLHSRRENFLPHFFLCCLPVVQGCYLFIYFFNL